MTNLEIITDRNKKSLVQNTHIIFNKLNLTNSEANLILGVLTSIQKALKK